jgi:DNA-binding response OmpR family regulator
MQRPDTHPDILVIEDDQDIAEFLTELLSLEGYRVATRADGVALEEVMAAPPRLLLLDLMLPESNGGDICRRLQADPRTRGVPVVIMTAAAPAMIDEWLHGCAYDGLLRKPFDIDELLALVERYVAKCARRGVPCGLAAERADELPW